MTTLSYTLPDLVTATRVTPAPSSGRTVTGYGSRIPTRHMIHYAGAWRRVYVMCYGNAGTAYVNVRGARVCLDPDTAYRLTDTG